MPVPAHRTQGWGDAIASFVLRLKTAGEGEPRQALDVADHSAKRLFDTLPIHSSYRELDEEVVYGAVRFRMIAVSQEMQRRMARRRAGARAASPRNVTLYVPSICLSAMHWYSPFLPSSS